MGTALSDLSGSVVRSAATATFVVLLTMSNALALEDDLDSGIIEPEAMVDRGDVDISDEALRGLLTRRTVTRFGDDFYRRFARQWQNTDHSGRQSIVIEERPSANRGSLITVRYAREVVFQGFVRPRGPNPEDVADAAVARVERWVRQYERTRGRSDPDLAEEELL